MIDAFIANTKTEGESRGEDFGFTKVDYAREKSQAFPEVIYNVRRSAIREALSGLRALGVLEMRQGESTFIIQFDASKFSLLLETALLMKCEDIRELSEVKKSLKCERLPPITAMKICMQWKRRCRQWRKLNAMVNLAKNRI